MTVVLFAVLIGLGGAFVVRQQMNRPAPASPQIPEPAKIAPMVHVPIAAINLAHGHTVSLTDVGVISLTQEAYAKSEFASQSFMTAPWQIIGRTIMNPVKKGAAFTPDMLYPVGSGPGIADRLKPGYRAVTVSIENVGAVTGFARPGAVVDVLFRSKADRDRPEVTLTLLERIEVLALNTASVLNATVKLTDEGSVTLAVTPPQAKVLKVVAGRGDLSLALRNPDDDTDFAPINLGQVGDPLVMADRRIEARNVSDAKDVRDTRETRDGVIRSSAEKVTLDDLLGIPKKPPKKTMEVYYGPIKQVYQFGGEPEEDPLRMIQHGNIRTPIAHEAPRRDLPVGNAQLDRHFGPQLSP
jgi:Flp pilus assembly protein CpaB